MPNPVLPHSAQELSTLTQQELINIILQQQSEVASADSEYNTFCRQIAENFPNGAVAILDAQLNYLHVGGEAMHRHGFTEEMFIGHSMRDVLSADESARLEAWIKDALQGSHRLTDITIDDQTYLVSMSPLLSKDGTVDRVLAVSQNITQQQVALRQAQESEAQFRTLAESIPGAVYVSTNDQDRKVLYISGGITGLCGYSVEEFVKGRISAADLIHVDDQKVNDETVAKAVANQQPYQLTYRLKHQDGSVCWIEEHGAGVTKDGKQYFQGVLFDVSEKKQYEEELQEQNEDLRRLNAELDHFTYSVSHDLRAPLSSALGLLSLLKEEKDPEQSKHYVALAEHSLHELNNFIQEVINLTRNAHTDLRVEAIDLQEMVNEVVASQQQNAAQSKVDIQTQIPAAEPLHTDRRRLRVVLSNLLSNAIRYYRTGHHPSFVRISATVKQQEVVLRVEDNGIGIDPESESKIFDMFYRATDNVPGSGLGLYLVQETVRKLNGCIKVDSQVNQGTTFTVVLPSLE
jgi:PAS domain S-box-containing protein